MVRPCLCSPGLFALISQAIWANQKQTHQLDSPFCGKVYFDFGPSFALATLVWILCVIMIVIRVLFRKHFSDPVDGEGSHVEMTDISGDVTPATDYKRA